MSRPDRAVARAIDALRRGWPVGVSASDGRIAILAIEGADDGRLAAFDPDGASAVLLSAGRAATLHLTNQREAANAEGDETGGAVRIARVPWLDLPSAVALADPALDLARPLNGPWKTESVAAPIAAAAALRLARLAGLLPAFFVMDAGEVEVEIEAPAIALHDAPARLAIASRARLPIAAAEQCEIVAFRNPDDAAEHIALVIGTPDGNAPLVRLHSECLTGDALGSLKCDCGPQLQAALHGIADSGGGILLYLRQEGRGIGLVNKLRAYALQDQGFDTVDANVRLGFAIDERDFGVAAAMLRLLGQDRVSLMTNNPAKVAGLEAAGITVEARVAHAMTGNTHNHAYLATKRDRTGHLL